MAGHGLSTSPCNVLSSGLEPRQHALSDGQMSVPHRDTVDSDQFKREEDFYYTEMQMKEESALAVAAPPAPGTPTGEPASTSRVTSPSLAALSLPPAKVQSSGPEHPGLESPLPSVALSKSAPGSFWHIQADHAYQVWDKRMRGLGSQCSPAVRGQTSEHRDESLSLLAKSPAFLPQRRKRKD